MNMSFDGFSSFQSCFSIRLALICFTINIFNNPLLYKFSHLEDFTKRDIVYGLIMHNSKDDFLVNAIITLCTF